MLFNFRTLPENVLCAFINKLKPVAYVRLRRSSRIVDEFAETKRDLLNIRIKDTTLVLLDNIRTHQYIYTFEPPPIPSDLCEILIKTKIPQSDAHRLRYRMAINEENVAKTVKAISGFRFGEIECVNDEFDELLDEYSDMFHLIEKVVRQTKCVDFLAQNITGEQMEKLKEIVHPRRLGFTWDASKKRIPKFSNWDVASFVFDLLDFNGVENSDGEVITSEDVENFLSQGCFCQLHISYFPGPIGIEEAVLKAVKNWQVGKNDATFIVNHEEYYVYENAIEPMLSGSMKLIPFWSGHKVNLGPTFTTDHDIEPSLMDYECGSMTPMKKQSWLVPSVSSAGRPRWGLLQIDTEPKDRGDRHSVVLKSLSSSGCPLDINLLIKKLPQFFINCPPIDFSTLRILFDSCPVTEWSAKFSMFYTDLKSRIPFRTSISPFPWMLEKYRGSLKILQMPELFLNDTLRKMSGTSFVRMRRSCKEMNSFIERKLDLIKFSIRPDACLSLVADVIPSRHMHYDNEAVKLEVTQIGIQCRPNHGEFSFLQPMTPGIAPFVRKATSGFKFKTIEVNRKDPDVLNEMATFYDAFDSFLQVIYDFKCHSLIMTNLSSYSQMNILMEKLEPKIVHINAVIVFDLQEFPYLWENQCEQLQVSFHYYEDLHGELDIYNLTREKTHFSMKAHGNIASMPFKYNITRMLKAWQEGKSNLQYFRVKYVDSIDFMLHNWISLENKILLFEGQRPNLGRDFNTRDLLEPWNTTYRFGDDTPFNLRVWLLPRVTSTGKKQWALLSLKHIRLNNQCHLTIRLQLLSTPDSPLDTSLLANCLPYLVLNCPPLTFDVLKDRLDSSPLEEIGAEFTSFIERIKNPMVNSPAKKRRLN